MIWFLKAIWRILTGISRAISVLVPLIFVAVFLVFFSLGMQESTPEPLPEKAALLIAPSGPLVEDAPPVDPVAAFVNQEFEQPTLLQNLINAISWAATDDRITALVLNLENLAGPSTTQAIELNEAISAFKATEKPVIAVGDFYSQAHYLLAAQADHILLHPEGGIFLEGFSVYRSYLRSFLENIRVTMHVFKAGEHKSAVEPYLRDDMSDGEREVVTRWLNGLWLAYTDMAESGRKLPSGSLDQFIEDFPTRLASSDNDMAETMIAGGWIDALADHSERDAALAEWVGVTDEEGNAKIVELGPYIEDVKAQKQLEEEGLPLIAIVPVEGTLVPGDSEDGMAGADTVISYIDMALEADDLAAIVLRVNSPGGSVFASDLIRRKLTEARTEDIPIVVSMGTVAASGGYWIAAEADQIWAQKTTLTGSIGAFSAFPTIEGIVDYIGVSVDGVGTTSLAGEASLNRGLSPKMATIVQAISNGIYSDFIELVASGRGMDIEEVQLIAEGMVWTGEEALANGLVDQLGGLDAAVSAAAELADLEQWRVGRTRQPATFESVLLEELNRSLGVSSALKGGWFESLISSYRPIVKSLSALRDPMNLYAQCFTCAPVP